MKDIRDMRRSDWHRILERRYTVSPCRFQGIEGVVSLLEIEKVTNPLTVHYETGDVLIADRGFSWLQLALNGQYFWATAMYDADGEFLEIYFDITGGNTFDDMENPRFQDMYLDIVLLADGRIHVLDRDELDAALAQKEISEEEYTHAIAECDRLYAFLTENKENIVAFCTEWREKLLEENAE
ncbi:MAG: DUF402 domain-containing protein [Lachnospiraceae bacterium]